MREHHVLGIHACGICRHRLLGTPDSPGCIRFHPRRNRRAEREVPRLHRIVPERRRRKMEIRSQGHQGNGCQHAGRKARHVICREGTPGPLYRRDEQGHRAHVRNHGRHRQLRAYCAEHFRCRARTAWQPGARHQQQRDSSQQEGSRIVPSARIQRGPLRADPSDRKPPSGGIFSVHLLPARRYRGADEPVQRLPRQKFIWNVSETISRT